MLLILAQRAKGLSWRAEPSLGSGPLVAQLAMCNFERAERATVRSGLARLFANPVIIIINQVYSCT